MGLATRKLPFDARREDFDKNFYIANASIVGGPWWLPETDVFLGVSCSLAGMNTTIDAVLCPPDF